MSKKKEPEYGDLNRNLSDKEIVDSYVLRGELGGDEKRAAEEEFRKLRLARLKEMSDSQILQGELYRMKLLMRDYFKQSAYLEEFSFSEQLKGYIALLKKSMKAFSSDLDIHKTKLSRLVNDKENPNIDLMYRLEKHSGGIIPATYWFKLHSRKLEDEIRKNLERREEEYKRVKNELNFKKTA